FSRTMFPGTASAAFRSWSAHCRSKRLAVRVHVVPSLRAGRGALRGNPARDDGARRMDRSLPDGEPYLDKPPLFYWLVGISYRVFGVHNAPARLVPALAIHAC